MTLIIYEPAGPALEFIGHAGAGLRGSDPVCAALSILLYTLIEAVPAAEVKSGDGWCRVDAGKNQTAAQRSGCGLEKEEGGSRSAAFVTPRVLRAEPNEVGLRGKRKTEGADVEFSPPGGNGTARVSFDAAQRSGDTIACHCEGRERPVAIRSPGTGETNGRGIRIPTASVRTGLGMTGEGASSDAGAFSGGESSVKPDAEAAFAVILGGLRLLADNFPQYVRMEVKE